MKTRTIPIKGMHCRSCEITVADQLEALPGVDKARVSVGSKSATIYAPRTLPSDSDIESAVVKAGYEVGYETKPWISRNRADYMDVLLGIAVVLAVGGLVGALDLANLSTGSLVSGGVTVPLIVGLSAGFSTCMALIGGLVMGLSAKYAEHHPAATTNQKFRPHLFFNASRIAAFFILGGAIGAVGSALQFNGLPLGLMTIGVGVVMFLLGLQLTKIFPRLGSGGLTLPTGLSKRLGLQTRHNQSYRDRNAALLGAVSFVLPCGFTQAMQLYAISTGSFTTGALAMGMFAIGTTPGLLGVGGLTSAVQGPGSLRFFKVTGVVVAAMALVTIANGYNLTGWPRIFNDASSAAESGEVVDYTLVGGKVAEAGPVDELAALNNKLQASYTVASGMVPTTFRVSAQQDYVLEVYAMEDGVGCMSTILIPGLNNGVQYLLKGQTNQLAFKAQRPGTYQITCAMGVPHGEIIVI